MAGLDRHPSRWQHSVSPAMAAACIAIAAAAVAAIRTPGVLLQVVLFCVGAPVVEELVASRSRRTWLAWLGLSGLALALDLPSHDRWALFVLVALIDVTRDLGLRMLAVAGTLMVIAGGTPAEPLYLAASAIQGVLVLAWLARRQRVILARQGIVLARARAGAVVVHAVLATIVAAMSISLLPATERWLLERSIDLTGERQTGFAPITDLNSVSQIKSSSRLALRVFAPAARLLRGQVFLTYHRGVWSSPPGSRPLSSAGADSGRDVAPVAGRREHIKCMLESVRVAFVPLETRAVVSPGLEMSRDSEGVVRSMAGPVLAYEYWLSPSIGAPPDAARRALLTAVPAQVAAELMPLAAEWTRKARTDRERAEAIGAALGRRCTYTLSPGSPGPEEPIVRFLRTTRRGHCEYFASAMALALRCLHIPARYVTGYSAIEKNPMGNYLMARDSDAHAWVEAWLDGEGWASFDPTPPDWHAGGRTSWSDWLGEVADACLEWLEEMRERTAVLLAGERDTLARRPAFLLVAALLVGLLVGGRVILAKVRAAWLRVPQSRRDPGPPADPERAAASASLSRLDAMVSELGVVRRASETLEELARRLAAQGLARPAAEALADLARMYGSFRYGGAPWDRARASGLLDAIARAAGLSARARTGPPDP